MTDRPSKRNQPSSNDVEMFLAALDHPFKPEILALRRAILDADPSITEGIKWNAPSFRTTEYFATMHLRANDGVQIILHLGAKKREDATARGKIADPESLLSWLGEDRASLMFRNLQEVEARRAALADLISQWIRHVQ